MDTIKQVCLINGSSIFTFNNVLLEGPYITVRGFTGDEGAVHALISMLRDDPVIGAQQLGMRPKFDFDIPRTSILYVKELEV